MSDEDGWLLLGVCGQAVFMGRFVLQWLASERDGRSVMPVPFWYLSIAGALVLLVYALHRRDPVFVAGQGLGVAIYLRNLQLIRRSAHREQRDPGREHAQHGAPGPAEPGEVRRAGDGAFTPVRMPDSDASGNTTRGSAARLHPGTGCDRRIPRRRACRPRARRSVRLPRPGRSWPTGA